MEVELDHILLRLEDALANRDCEEISAALSTVLFLSKLVSMSYLGAWTEERRQKAIQLFKLAQASLRGSEFEKESINPSDLPEVVPA